MSNDEFSDLSYHPVGHDVDEILESKPPARLLLIGEDLPESFAVAESVRHVPEPAVELPTGVYSFDAADGTGVMVVATGGPPANSASACGGTR